jgi:hypothetical protein
MREIRLRVPARHSSWRCSPCAWSIGGSAYAGVKLGKGSVRTKNLHNQAVTERKLRDAADAESKLANGAVTHGEIADRAVWGSNFAVSGIATKQGSFTVPAGVSRLEPFSADGVQSTNVLAYNVAERLILLAARPWTDLGEPRSYPLLGCRSAADVCVQPHGDERQVRSAGDQRAVHRDPDRQEPRLSFGARRPRGCSGSPCPPFGPGAPRRRRRPSARPAP